MKDLAKKDGIRAFVLVNDSPRIVRNPDTEAPAHGVKGALEDRGDNRMAEQPSWAFPREPKPPWI